MARLKGQALKVAAAVELIKRVELDLGHTLQDHVGDLLCDKELVSSWEQAVVIKALALAELGRRSVKADEPFCTWAFIEEDGERFCYVVYDNRNCDFNHAQELIIAV